MKRAINKNYITKKFNTYLSDYLSRRNYYFSVFPNYIILLFSFLFLNSVVFSQEVLTVETDSVKVSAQEYPNDSLSVVTNEADTSKVEAEEQDTIRKSSSAFGLDTNVHYFSRDSIRFDLNNQKVFLYGNAQIDYGNISLKADYIEIDFSINQAFAKGVPDSLGKLFGTPVFSEGGQTFESKELTYNFDSKKGIIKEVITQDGQGYLHGEIIKKMPNGRINIWKGWYTTCDHNPPHYGFRYNKAQVIPDNKIVSGPAYLEIEGVPVPLFIPFGLFPNKSGQRSGIIIPSFGESENRGYFLEGVGYYWGINDYLDLTVIGNIYTSGSWAIRPSLNYKKRYRYNGNFNFGYTVNILGDRDSPDHDKKKDFNIRWMHSQDPKAKPNSRFSANVYIVSSSYNEFNLTSTQAYLTNTFQSSIAYQKNWSNKYFLTLNASHQQNTIDGSISITLPQLTFNTKQFYPFRKKIPVGKPRWYENINVKYTMNAENRINTRDTLIFKPGWDDDFKNGMKHTIPISTSIKILKHFTLTNSINYTGRLYPWTIRKEWINDSLFTATDTIVGYVETDTVHNFKIAHDFSFRASLNTKLYGMFQFKKGPVTAIRHVLTPSVSFSYHPDFGSDFWGYYHDVQTDTAGNYKRYSIFEEGIYGTPPDGKSGTVSFSLNNNLEMKVRSRKDTISGTKKIKLIDNFSISTSYNLAKDSLNWAPLSMSGRTILFKKFNITYSSTWDPYVLDSAGMRNLNRFEWDVNHRLFRLENTVWNLGLNWQISSNDLKGKKKELPSTLENDYTEEELRDVFDNPESYIDWDNPWRFNINYNFMYSNNPAYINNDCEDNRTFVQTLGFGGDISITPKWKIVFRSGFDFETCKFTYTSIDIHRDLHCWEMHLNWVPMGGRKSWNFGINVKASILKDMKYSRKKDFRDHY